MKLLDFDIPLLYTCLKALSTRKCSDFDIGGIGVESGNFLKLQKDHFVSILCVCFKLLTTDVFVPFYHYMSHWKILEPIIFDNFHGLCLRCV